MLTLPSEIKFDLSQKEPTTILKVHNGTDEQVAFKVKTTTPKRYLVRPNQDVLEGGRSVEVRISLQAKDARAILEAGRSSPASVAELFKDKFMVQSMEMKAEFKTYVESVRAKDAQKPMSDILSGLWKQVPKDELTSVKLVCNFDLPPSGTAVDATEAANPIRPAATNSAEQDLTSLRRKYNELVNFSVQLTAERDRLKNSCKEASKELNSWRQRGAQGEVSGKAGNVQTVSTSVSGFSLWQLMLIAVIAFIAGRLLEV